MKRNFLYGSFALLQSIFLFPVISAAGMTGATIDGIDSVIGSSGAIILLLVAVIIGVILLRKFSKKKKK